ncbi:MAG: hypothetical protein ACRD8K_05425 [Nitrososphaeraceae archaeon]
MGSDCLLTRLGQICLFFVNISWMKNVNHSNTILGTKLPVRGILRMQLFASKIYYISLREKFDGKGQTVFQGYYKMFRWLLSIQ